MIDIEQLKKQFLADSETAKSAPAVQELRNKYFSRKHGLISKAFEEFAVLPLADKQKLGQPLNAFKQQAEATVQSLARQFGAETGKIDLTVPPQEPATGHLHPLTQAMDELVNIFLSLGFSAEFGYEVESDWYNFTALNFPENHPARDMQDTFFIKQDGPKASKERLLLRTHTSPMQIRYMQSHKPPFSIVVPGTVYRNEATDATHGHTFNQLEGLVVGDDVTMSNMVWTLDYMIKKFFGSETKTKLLPAYFPFVEPGAELAMSSPSFKNGKWIELLGCGMVHQNVFKAAGYPEGKYQGFAFGFGVDRFALMKFGITDIRLLSQNDLRFLKQF